METYRTPLYISRIILDIIVLISSIIISAYISVLRFNFLQRTQDQFLILLLCIIWLFSSKVIGLYDEFRSRNFSYELIFLIKNIFIQVISVIIILFMLKEYLLSRYFVVWFAFVSFFLLGIERFLLRRLLNYLRRRGRNLRNLIIVGAGKVGKNFYDVILRNPHFGYNVIGFLDDRHEPSLNGMYLGNIDELEKILNRQKIDDVIIALPNYAMERLENAVKVCERHTTRIKIIPDYFRFVASKYNITMFDRFPIISVRNDRLNEMHWRILKRSFDIGITLLLFIFVFSWLWPLIGFLIKISSPGPVFFEQERLGKNNEKFITYKFRSMRTDCNEVDCSGKYQQAKKDDPRITKIGGILRKTNLDELPQFWNVLKGDMSIVGPRPHPTPLNKESKDKVYLYMLRHLAKPGITGWAQVNGYRGETGNLELMQKRVDHDVWYIENWSFMLDLQIIFLTVWRMIKGDPNAY